MLKSTRIFYATERHLETIWVLAYQVPNKLRPDLIRILSLTYDHPQAQSIEADKTTMLCSVMKDRDGNVEKILFNLHNPLAMKANTVTDPHHFCEVINKKHYLEYPLSLLEGNIPEEIQTMLDNGADFEIAKECLDKYNAIQEINELIKSNNVGTFYEHSEELFFNHYDIDKSQIEETIRLDEEYGLENLIKCSNIYNEIEEEED